MLILAQAATGASPAVWLGLSSLPVILGLILVICGSKFAKGGIGRNSAVGIRTAKLMASDEAWEVGHRAAAGTLSAAGWITIALGVVGAIVGIFAGLDSAVAGIVSVVFVIPAIVGVLLATQKAHRAVDELS